jgi:hypothetical protein
MHAQAWSNRGLPERRREEDGFSLAQRKMPRRTAVAPQAQSALDQNAALTSIVV